MSTPQTDPSLLPLITAGATLASAFVGGLVGVAITWMAHRFTAKREVQRYATELRTKRCDNLREKLEKLLTLVMAYRERLAGEGTHTYLVGYAMARGAAAPDLAEAEELPEFDQALAIQVLYFPNLEPVLEALRQGVVVFRRVLEAEYAAMAQDPVAWAGGPGRTAGVRFGQALAAYQQAEGVLARTARALIETELADPN